MIHTNFDELQYSKSFHNINFHKYTSISLHTHIHTDTCTHIHEHFVRVRFITVITQFQVNTAMNYRVITHCMNLIFTVGHEGASSLFLSQFIMPVL